MRTQTLAIAITLSSGIGLVAPSFAEADTDCDPRVEAIVAKRPKLVEYCERCGDKAPGMPYVAAEGQRTDARYTYVQTTPERYDNLALMAGCDPDLSAPPSLTVSDATEHGVMITADHTAQPPQQITYQQTTIERPIPWLIIALAACGGALTGTSLFLLAVARRRRSPMRPRAGDLRVS